MVATPLSNADFLVRYVLQPAGPRAPEFIAALRRRARERRVVHGKCFTDEEIEKALIIFSSCKSAEKPEFQNPQKAYSPDSAIPVAVTDSSGLSLSLNSGNIDSRTASLSVLAHAMATPARSTAGMSAGAQRTVLGTAASEAQVQSESAISRGPSISELKTHAGSSQNLGAAEATPAAPEKIVLSVKGTSVNVRARPPRLTNKTDCVAGAVAAGANNATDAVAVTGSSKRVRSEDAASDAGLKDLPAPKRAKSENFLQDSSMQAQHVPQTDESSGSAFPFGVPPLLDKAEVPDQLLRISAGRAAAAAGIHPFTDIGEMFLEFVYQDLPDLLLRDAAVVGIEIVSPVAERARLLEKSGQGAVLEAIMRRGADAIVLEPAREAQREIGTVVTAALESGRLSEEEASELQRTLEKEVNLEFGERHEDAAISAYEAQIGYPVYGQQRRVSLALPKSSPHEALSLAFPPLRQDPLPPPPEKSAEEHTENHGTNKPYFRLTGFVDGLVDLPREGCHAGSHSLETCVVEVKHRMGKIRDPPNIYDVVQLCSYCRVFGLKRGHLVQCLRDESTPDRPVGSLHVMNIDFSEGSADRTGWDEHVLSGLYSVAEAVYAVRKDEAARLKLLATTDPAERKCLVGEFCPHLG